MSSRRADTAHLIGADKSRLKRSFAWAKSSLLDALYRSRIAIIPEWRLGTFPFVQHVRAVFSQRNIDMVLDVGANVGGFSQMLRKQVGFHSQIVSFEPVSSSFARLRARAASDTKWSVHQIALGSAAATATINVTTASEFASFLSPKETNLFPEWNRVERRETASVCRLDDFMLANHIDPKRAYLKIDTQGFDLEVLKGCTGIINVLEAIQVELSFRPIYKETPSYIEVLSVLSRMGFVISGMYPINLTNMMAIEMDCILVRDTGDDPLRTVTNASLVKRGVLIPRALKRPS